MSTKPAPKVKIYMNKLDCLINGKNNLINFKKRTIALQNGVNGKNAQIVKVLTKHANKTKEFLEAIGEYHKTRPTRVEELPIIIEEMCKSQKNLEEIIGEINNFKKHLERQFVFMTRDLTGLEAQRNKDIELFNKKELIGEELPLDENIAHILVELSNPSN